MEKDMVTGEAARELRESLGLSQEEAAAVIGKSRWTIASWERDGAPRWYVEALKSNQLARSVRMVMEGEDA